MVARRDPIQTWRDRIGRSLLNLDFKVISDAPFHTTFKPLNVGLRAAQQTFSPGFTFRDNELVKDGDDAISLIICQSKQMDVVQGEHKVRLRRGEALLLPHDAPGMLGAESDHKFIAVSIPRADLLARDSRINDRVLLRAPRQSEILLLLQDYLEAIGKRQLIRTDSLPVVREHVLDLIALVFSQDTSLGETNHDPITNTRTEAALDYIRRHFSDPSLNLTSVAKALAISPRYLQRLLENSEKSFSALINELRLQEAFRLLTSSEFSALLISDIAFRCGFSDISHFNRLFRLHFGDTPSAIKAAKENSGDKYRSDKSD